MGRAACREGPESADLWSDRSLSTPAGAGPANSADGGRRAPRRGQERSSRSRGRSCRPGGAGGEPGLRCVRGGRGKRLLPGRCRRSKTDPWPQDPDSVSQTLPRRKAMEGVSLVGLAVGFLSILSCLVQFLPVESVGRGCLCTPPPHGEE